MFAFGGGAKQCAASIAFWITTTAVVTDGREIAIAVAFGIAVARAVANGGQIARTTVGGFTGC